VNALQLSSPYHAFNTLMQNPSWIVHPRIKLIRIPTVRLVSFQRKRLRRYTTTSIKVSSKNQIKIVLTTLAPRGFSMCITLVAVATSSIKRKVSTDFYSDKKTPGFQTSLLQLPDYFCNLRSSVRD